METSLDAVPRVPSGRVERGGREARRQAALLARGLAEEVAIALREVRRRDEAAGERYVDHREVGLQQQQSGAVEPQLDVVARGRAVEVLAEQPLELAARQAGGRSQRRPGQRLLQTL